MTKYLQKQILELLETVSEALQYVKSFLRDHEMVKGILIDSYSAIEHIKNTLLESESASDSKGVVLAVNILDKLELLNEQIFLGEDCVDLHDNIVADISQVKVYVEQEILIKKEIVFLPYKTAMWDSMESIWRAANEDERCEAVVIPIPYYDKDQEGNLAFPYYEASRYPKDVPVTYWGSYDLEAHEPDVVYVHNPYDYANYVTSIHPDFYIENLKKYCKRVVYVPYFASAYGIEKHFCLLPGVLYSDNVVVQTEKIKKAYLATIREFEEENNLPDNAFNENSKFVVFGSPKFDRALNLKETDYEIPEQWKKFIHGKDGSRKKVILFNTSLQELLVHREQQIEKIKSVIRIFSGKDNIVLLWRPHPLNESTTKAMLPHILEDYLELIRHFKDNELGIYDDTENLYNAIAISDAYYGTGGSLVPLFALTGKPVMRENTVLINEESSDLRNVLTESLFVENGKVWFSGMEFNSLFCYDLRKQSLEWKGVFPYNNFYRKYCYYKAIKYKDTLIFPPYSAAKLAIYNLNDSTFRGIDIKTYHGMEWMKFYSPVRYENNLFIFGARTPAIVKMNLDTFEVIYLEEMYQDLSKYFSYDQITILASETIVKGQIAYLLCSRANVLIAFNMADLSYEFIEVGSRDAIFIDMVEFDDRFYLIPRNGCNVFCWDYRSKMYYEIESPEEGIETNAYYKCNVTKDTLYLYASKGNNNAMIRKGSRRLEIIESDLSKYTSKNDISQYEKDERRFICTYSGESEIYYLSALDRYLYKKNADTGEISKNYLRICDKDYKKILQYMFIDRENCETVDGCIYKESDKLTLDDYIEWVANNDSLFSKKQVELFVKQVSDADGECGQLCHKEFNV